MSPSRRRCFGWLLATRVIVLVSVSLALLAQQPTMIRGAVTDSSGAVIPAATVSLSGPNTQKTVQTTSDGSYAFSGLAAGADYTLKVVFPGFEPFEQRVTVATGGTLQVPIQLKLQAATESVTVTEDTIPVLSIEPGEATDSTVVKGSDLEALPDNPDDLTDMLQLLDSSPGSQVQIVVDGFTGGQLPSKDTIKEIKINQNLFSAANQWAWAPVEIVTKPGTDKLHGSFGFTDSNAAFNSRNPYAENKADYVNRMYTANLGSSIKKRASYSFNFYQNTINNTALINAVTLDPATLTPTPVQRTVVVPRDDISWSGKLDYQLSANHTLTGSYRYLQSHRDNNGVGQYNLETRGYPSRSSTHEIHLRETALLNGNIATDTRVGYTRNANQQSGDTSVPSLMVAGAFNGGSAQTGQTSNLNALVEIQNDTIDSLGAHTIRFGGVLRRNSITDVSPSNFGGTFSFFGVTDAPVLDANNQPMGNETSQVSSLEQYRRTLLFQSLGYSPALIRSLGGGASQFSIAAGNPLVRFNQTELGFYVDDAWRMRPNFTLSLGLRYQRQLNIGAWKDFAPRVAIAWSPGAKNSTNPKTVFRAGSGYFYADVNQSYVQQSLRFNGASEQQYLVLNPDFYPTIPALSSFTGVQSLTTYRLDPHIRPPAFFMTSVSVERQLPGKTTFSVKYSYQRGTHMSEPVNINAPLPGTYAAGLPIYPYGQEAGNIFQYESVAIQKDGWLEVHVNSNPNRKISIIANYTFETHASNNWDCCGQGSTPSNPYNLNQDWGRPFWDVRNWFNLTGTLTAPKGIQFSLFLIAQGGQPYNLIIGSDIYGTTVANERPAFATDLSRSSVVITRFGAFDTNPMPGQKIVPLNYLTGAPSWLVNMRVSKTFQLGGETSPAGSKAPAQRRYGLNFNIDVNNLLNHLNEGGFVGNLSSPLFGQSTSMNNGFRDTSNNRKVQFGTQFTF